MLRSISRAHKLMLALGLAVTLVSCAPTMTPLPIPTHGPAEQIANPDIEVGSPSNSDPFVYCAAVGTIDTPDERYNGATMPEPIVQGMIQQGIVSADAPLEFQQSAVWRCMNSSVWVCHFGANLPCQEKADTAQVPTSEMEDYCKANPTAEFIPAAVTGRATVYEWACKDGKSEVVKQLFKSDAQGYLADFWYELTPK
jgi:hypothetical protein